MMEKIGWGNLPGSETGIPDPGLNQWLLQPLRDSLLYEIIAQFLGLCQKTHAQLEMPPQLPPESHSACFCATGSALEI